MISNTKVRFDRPYDFDVFSQDLQMLQTDYSKLHTEVIGWSVMGKPIHAIRLGAGPIRLHYNGAFHANEWITSMLLMRFVEECSAALYGQHEEETDIGDSRSVSLNSLMQESPIQEGTAMHAAELKDIFTSQVSLWVVPMVNPDGVDLSIHGISSNHPHYWQVKQWNMGSELFWHWKANIRGVDLNDQFPAHWDEEVSRRDASGPGPRDYPGIAPLTEPEAKALADFTKRLDFHAVFAFHTQGEEIYWNYRGYEPDQASMLAEQLAQASGYAAIELTGSDAGYKDWFIQEFGRPGFTVEAGFGENPLPLQAAPDIYQKLKPLLLRGLTLLTN